MTNEQQKAKELAGLLNAFADGKQLEYKAYNTDWQLCRTEYIMSGLAFDFFRNVYQIRIKPERKIVNLTQQDLIDRASSGKTMWVKKHVTSSLITCIRPDKVYVGERGIDYGMLRVEYTFLDNTPCYKDVENE